MKRLEQRKWQMNNELYETMMNQFDELAETMDKLKDIQAWKELANLNTPAIKQKMLEAITNGDIDRAIELYLFGQ